MAQNEPLRDELGMVRSAVAGLFTGRALAWQLGGAMAAGLWLVFTSWIGSRFDSITAFVLASVGFVGAYVVLCATGFLVAYAIDAAGEGRSEDSTGPLHFLVDNLASAMLLPLVLSGVAVVLAAILVGLAYLWHWGVAQWIMAVPSVLVFVLVLIVVAALIVVPFVLPAMAVMEPAGFAESFRRVRSLWSRKTDVVRVFGTGLAASMLAVAPAMLVVLLARAAITWIYQIACGDPFVPFAQFVLELATGVLLWAPILTAPLALMTSLGLVAYDDLFEAEEPEDETSEVPAPGAALEVKLPMEPAREINGQPAEPAPGPADPQAGKNGGPPWTT